MMMTKMGVEILYHFKQPKVCNFIFLLIDKITMYSPIGSEPTEIEVKGVGEIMIVQERMGTNVESTGSTLSASMLLATVFFNFP